jgi:hypothetical protein
LFGDGGDGEGKERCLGWKNRVLSERKIRANLGAIGGLNLRVIKSLLKFGVLIG